MDIHSKEVRSYNMSQVRGKDTKPEMLVRRFLHKNGFRYRLHVKDLPGKPDLVLPKYKTVIFIHGCFWHGHEGCGKATIPKTNSDWWRSKIGKNIANDEKGEDLLSRDGWKVLTVWGCQLSKKNIENTLNELVVNLLNQAAK